MEKFLVIKAPSFRQKNAGGFVTFVMVVEAKSAKAAIAAAQSDNAFLDDDAGRSGVYSKATAKPLEVGVLYRL